MNGQKFYMLCEKVDTENGPMLVRLTNGDIGAQPFTELSKAIEVAEAYVEAEDVPVFIMEAHIIQVVGYLPAVLPTFSGCLGD